MTFSVIIPVYNRTTTLKSAIDSVLAQSFRDFEILVVDDCSDQPTTKALIPYMSLIRYIRHDSNMGVSAARNTGIKASKGKYIAFLDSDDVWLPQKLERQYNALENGAMVVHTDEFWLKRDKFINPGKKHKRYGGFIFDKILDMCRMSPSSVALNREVFKKCGIFDKRMRVCEDYDLWLRVCSAYEVSYLPEKTIIKRAITADQLSDSIRHIEYIRLVSLARFVRCRKISSVIKSAALKEIKRKADIINSGINNF